ncbi:MAG: hypothetical protein RLO37_14590 [Coleofasciculus chthonoplastes F1-TOW-03]
MTPNTARLTTLYGHEILAAICDTLIPKVMSGKIRMQEVKTLAKVA